MEVWIVQLQAVVLRGEARGVLNGPANGNREGAHSLAADGQYPEDDIERYAGAQKWTDDRCREWGGGGGDEVCSP